MEEENLKWRRIKPNQTNPSVKPHSALMMSQNLISRPRPATTVRPIVRQSALLEIRLDC